MTNTAVVLTVAVIIGAVALVALPSRKYDTPPADAAAASAPIDTIVTPRGIMPNTLVTPAAPASVVGARMPATEAAASAQPEAIPATRATETSAVAATPIVRSVVPTASGDLAPARKPEIESSNKTHSEAATRPAAEPPATSASDSVPTANAELHEPTPITISGCLESSATKFRLKDTDGVAAPKSRSWKSAFLKKSSSPLMLVDVTNTLKFPSHIGQRVSATGTLVNGEMRARTLKVVSSSCR